MYGLAAAFWGRGAALAAGIAYALWPAGVAVSSVTGTDMPAGVLMLGCSLGAGALGPLAALGRDGGVRAGHGPRRLGARRDGAAGGLCAVLLSGGGGDLAQSLLRAGAGALIALLVLAPWVLRNHARYGEWMLTDSHGGLTALVGANPNTDGRYSRSLNRLFKEVTGYTLLAEPHRAADRAAYALARDWSAFSPPTPSAWWRSRPNGSSTGSAPCSTGPSTAPASSAPARPGTSSIATDRRSSGGPTPSGSR